MEKLHGVCGSVPRTPDRVTSWLSGLLSSCQPEEPGQGREAVPGGEQGTRQTASPAEALGTTRQAHEVPSPPGRGSARRRPPSGSLRELRPVRTARTGDLPS